MQINNNNKMMKIHNYINKSQKKKKIKTRIINLLFLNQEEKG